MRSSSMLVVCLVALTSNAFAEGTDAPADQTAPATMPDPSAPPPPAVIAPAPAPAPTPGIRASGLRNGFSMSAGQEFGTVQPNNVDFSAQLYGFDWRIGARLAPVWSVYLHSHLSLGTGNFSGGGSGKTGNFATAVMGERDLPNRIFVAAGGGYGVLNNPSGPMLALRAGWYPMKHADGVARRLNVALDTRFYFVEAGGQSMTMNHVAISFGYDRF